MNSSKIKIGLVILVSVGMMHSFIARSQDQLTISEPVFTGDSLSITQVISQVIKNYPTVKEAEEALNAADAKIGLARSGYYPYLSADASFTRLGPVSSISIPELGSFDLYPANNYSAAIDYRHTIFDFGKTSSTVDLAKESKVLSELSVDDVKQKLSITAMSTFYTIAFLQKAILIKDDELKALYEHLQFVQKKKETGSATQYEILSTKVKISGVESQKVDLQTAFNVQLSILNNLLGLPENTDQRVSYNLEISLPDVPDDSLMNYAVSHRDEMKIALQKSTLAQMNYKVVKSQTNPAVGLYASGGWKNGYFPEMDKFTANYAAGVGLNIPIFDANRKKYNLLQANSQIQSLDYQTDLTKRNISDDLVRNETRLKATAQKVDQYQLQLAQAQEAYDLAKTNFKAGAITNLDLLDASTSVSESELLLLKSRIDYVVSIYGLKASLGQKLY